MYKIVIFLFLCFSQVQVQAQAPEYTPNQYSQQINNPVSEGHRDFNFWYIIGTLITAVSAMFGLCLYLLRIIFSDKDANLIREIDRSKSSETSIRDILLGINNTLQNIVRALEEIKGTTNESKDKLRQNFDDLLEDIEKLLSRIKQ